MIVKKIIACILVGLLSASSVGSYTSLNNTNKDISIYTDSAKNPLDSVQLNSITMLNYLTYLTQCINESDNSRIFLEETYTSLINNTDPAKIDANTLSYLNQLLDTLNSYRMLSVKRDRLEYIYEQNQANAMRSAVPNPIGLLSAVSSGNVFQAMTSVVYMAVDSFTSYESAMSSADLEYLQDGWQLDDEEATTLHNSRTQLFTYMVTVVRDYNIPGEYSLNENAVQSFVSWQNNPNNISRLQFLEDNENVYRYFGPYWLALAECYYNNEDYEACLEAFDEYSSCTTEIFRRDYEYASALPMAITSAKFVMSVEEFDDVAGHYADLIIENSDASDWALRYFAAQTYMAIYHDTGDEDYLQSAYNTIATNVNELVQDQIESNEFYVEEFEDIVAPPGSTDQVENDVDDYNDYMDDLRSVELPPLSSALALNCELLWELADELEISDSERTRLDQLLHGYDTPCFLNDSVDNYFTFGEPDNDTASITIDLSDGQVIIPANLVSENSSIELLVIEESRQAHLRGWRVKKVKRNTEGDFSTYYVTFVSDPADSHEYVDGSSATLIITTPVGNTEIEERYYFDIEVTNYVFIIPHVEFIQTFN